MAKGEAKNTNKLNTAQLQTQNKNYGSFIDQQTARSGTAQERSDRLAGTLEEQYGNLASGNLAGAGYGGGGGGGWALPATYGQAKEIYELFGKTGGIDEEKIRQAGHGTMKEISETGGFDADTKARILRDIQKYRTLGETGGVDAAAQARMRGGGIFDEFARTGGVSEAEARNLRARGNAPISAMYGGMSDEMNRARRIRGGSSAMANAAALKMGRDRSKAAGEAALGTELGISDRVRQGRQWGGEGMASSEGNLQGLLSSNRLAGMGGALGGEMGLADTTAKNRLSGAGMWNQSESGIQEMLQRGKLSGAQGLESVAGAEAANAASNASAGSSNARYNDMLRMEGMEGLFKLRGQTPGEVNMQTGYQLEGIGGQAGAANQTIGQRYGAPGNNKSAWDTATNLLGAGAGIAGGLMTGGVSTGISGLGGAQNLKKLNGAWM